MMFFIRILKKVGASHHWERRDKNVHKTKYSDHYLSHLVGGLNHYRYLAIPIIQKCKTIPSGM